MNNVNKYCMNAFDLTTSTVPKYSAIIAVSTYSAQSVVMCVCVCVLNPPMIVYQQYLTQCVAYIANLPPRVFVLYLSINLLSTDIVY